jgi:hypothetical protein
MTIVVQIESKSDTECSKNRAHHFVELKTKLSQGAWLVTTHLERLSKTFSKSLSLLQTILDMPPVRDRAKCQLFANNDCWDGSGSTEIPSACVTLGGEESPLINFSSPAAASLLVFPIPDTFPLCILQHQEPVLIQQGKQSTVVAVHMKIEPKSSVFSPLDLLPPGLFQWLPVQHARSTQHFMR